MSLSILSSVTAMAPGTTTFVAGIGGTPPYVYSVVAGGAGGSVDSSTGLYTAPAQQNPDPSKIADTIRVTDSLSAVASVSIKTFNTLGLFCDILQNQLGLADGRVYIYNQKIKEPTDAGLFIAISVLQAKPFGNTNSFDADGNSVQSVNMLTTLSINAISRDTSALTRKEEIVLALFSNYSQSQQELNSFLVGRIPPGGQFVNVSGIDGAAIPYRFNISVNVQYFYKKVSAVPYYDDFEEPVITTEP